MIFRLSVFIKSVAPLQAHVSKKVLVLHALKSFSTAESSLGDEEVHLCQAKAGPSYFDKIEGKDELLEKAVDSIRHALRAYQVQFSEEIKKAGEQKRRAIYSVDIQFDEAKQNAYILGFSFAPAENLDYNEAFKALFLDETTDLAEI